MAKKNVVWTIIVVLCVLFFLNQASSQIEVKQAPPEIDAEFMIANNGPVKSGSPIVFIGACPGDNAALIVCRNNEICSVESSSVLCTSGFSSETEKSCSYTTTDSDAGIHESDVGTCCTTENECDSNTLPVEKWKVIKPSAQVQAEGLSLFPKNLRIRKEGGLIKVMNTTIIVGDQAPSEDALAAADVVNALVKPLNKRIFSVLESAVTDQILENDNLIIIGNSTINKFMAEWKGEEAALPESVAKIKSIGRERQQVIVIMGKESSQRRKAAMLLKNYEEEALEGSEICVTGNPEDKNDRERVSCSTLEVLPKKPKKEGGGAEKLPATKEISLSTAACMSGEKSEVPCYEEVRASDDRKIELAALKGHPARIAVSFSPEKIPTRAVLTLEQQVGDQKEQRVLVYVQAGTLRYACTLQAKQSGKDEEASCDITSLIKDKDISLVLEGATDLLLQYWRVDKVALQVAYSEEARVQSSSPVQVGGSIQFTGHCTGENSWLLVCRENAICNAQSPSESVICLSSATNTSEKRCLYMPESLDMGIHDSDIAACCTMEKGCDSTTMMVESWEVTGIQKEKEIQPVMIGMEELIQDPAEVEKPVRWVKKVQTETPVTNLTVKVPEKSKRVKIEKIVNETRDEVMPDNILMIDQPPEKALVIKEEVQKVEVEYFTEEPKVIDSEQEDGIKMITIYSEMHYTNISAHTVIRETTQESVRLFRTTGGIKESVPIERYVDRNSNGLVDEIWWRVSSLSNQTFMVVIAIIRAQHLNETYGFVSDIYNETREKDGIWSETIPADHIVRVQFEKNLTSDKDITIFPRALGGQPSIEVHEAGETEIIASFPAITDNEYNTVILTNLNGSQDAFDLRIRNGEIQLDHIIDPIAQPGGQTELRAVSCRGEASANSADTFANACAGTYPAACGGGAGNDRISCNDGNLETFGVTRGKFSGIMVNSTNETITNGDCQNLNSVFLCYEWWGTSGDAYSNCLVQVDADNGASFSTVNSSCPPLSANPGMVCNNVTTLESWQCSNFFDTAGNRARAKLELSRTSTGGGTTLSIDALFFNVSYTAPSNFAPTVTGVISKASESITESSWTNFTASFLATDRNGVADLDDSSAAINITTNGNIFRGAPTCGVVDINATTANYSCSLEIWYFDKPGNWTISASVKDLASVTREGKVNFTLLPTLAIVVGPSSLSFPSINPGALNITPLEAIAVNNTGNQNVTINNTQAKAFDLVGADGRIIPAGNFTVDISSGAGNPQCGVRTVLINNTVVSIINSIIPRGNNTLGNNPEHGKEQLFACLRHAPSSLSAQTYSASGGSAWIISAV